MAGMLRPFSRLFNIAQDSSAGGGGGNGGGSGAPTGFGALLAAKLDRREPGSGAELKTMSGAAGPKAAASSDDGAGAGADDPKPEDANANAGPGAGDEDPKPGEGGGESEGDEGQDGDEEAEKADTIAEGDSVEVQLKKLSRSHKRTLSRVDKLTAAKKELETELAATKQKLQQDYEAEPEGESREPLGFVKDEEGLKQTEREIEAYLKQLKPNATKGMTIKGADGKDIQLSPEDVVNEILHWTEVQAKQVPARRQHLQERARAQSEATERFKPWQGKAAFTEAKAEVEATMKKHAGQMADYELALHERALARMVLSGKYVITPKSNPAAAARPGAESAPVEKPKQPAAPVPPPTSGGPPIQKAGQGPDLRELEERMQNEPENRDLVKGYIKAKMAKV